MIEYGFITAYNSKHHVGIIKPDEGGEELLVTVNDLKSSGLENLARKHRVAFERVKDDRGREHAAHITVLQYPPVSTEERERFDYQRCLEHSIKLGF